MKRLFALLCVIACLAAFCVPAMAAQNDMIPVVVKVPGDWTNANLYAWDMDGNNLGAWPGTGMVKLDDGWYVGYVNFDMINVIVNNGSAQTADLELDWGEFEDGAVWITVGSDNAADIKYTKQNTAKIPSYDECFYTIHVATPGDWHNCSVWAWDNNQNNAYAEWPGAGMTKESGWYTIKVPVSYKNFLVSTSTGTQTVDINGSGKEQWVVLGEADAEGKLAVTVTEKAPEGYTPPEEDKAPEADTVTVHAAVPEAWTQALVWAWGEGPTNVYESWPGEAMTKGDDGWYTLEVPGFFNGIIINDGSSQTPDIAVEVGKDLWLDVTDPTNPKVSYEAIELPTAPAEPEQPTTQPTEPTTQAPTEPSTNAPIDTVGASDNDGGSNTGLIIGIVVAVVVVAAGAVAIFLILKKKD